MSSNPAALAAAFRQPPPGGDQNKGPVLLGITWAFTAICTVVVSLKIWTRFKIIGQTGMDDAFTILALLLLLAFAPLLTVSVKDGLGRHAYYLDPEDAIEATKLAIISNPLVFLAAAFPNISVAISLNRILVPEPWKLSFLIGIPILQCVVASICSIITYTECSPLRAIWDPMVPHKCIPTTTVLGLLYLNGDFPYAIYRLLTFAVLEAAFIIIAACIPSLRPFIRNLGRSLHLDLDHAKSLFIPRGYYHSHSRRHRPPPLVPRDSGSGATAVPSPRDKHERGEADLEGGSAAREKRQASTGNTPPSTAATQISMHEKAQEARSTL
ncbi:MAG: hypothetical protein LQ350_003187 [Teloschistes chrysophthalmus]|nr:MAG: hypothetical protein LQ350_003187 [Niorma chrysophthalma]